jgi:5-methylcytosine-specific restriction endonuclease McrA
MADHETHAQLEELRALMRHQIPDGDLGKILARAVALLHAQVRRRKFAETSRPRSVQPPGLPKETPSRHIPAAIRRAVSERDGGRCSYVSSSGQRCEAREFLEFDHVEAWAFNHAHSIGGITLRCRAHNQRRARIDFGNRHMARFQRSGPRSQLDSNPVV